MQKPFPCLGGLSVDVTVTRAEDDGQTWTLTDLLGRPIGRITKRAPSYPGQRFLIEPNERARPLMTKVDPGPYASLDEALTEIEKHTSMVCRRASE
jgi:hypothetical protein